MDAASGLTNWLAIAGLVIGTGGGIWALITTIVTKKLKSPADRQTEVEFGVQLLRDQITKAERDQTRWLDVEKFLREELRKTEADKERIQTLLDTTHQQLIDLRREKNELEHRLNRLARKASRGEPITLADITGQDPGLEEDTEEM
jgi:chromosome segregation ATPase